MMKDYQKLCLVHRTQGVKLSGGFLLAALLCTGGAATVRAQSDAATRNETSQRDEATVARGDAAAAARQLTNRDPLLRQRAAEELARLAAVRERKLVEGHRLQEKNERVKLALDWALYRMGKKETLFAVVRALDSRERRNQAYTYLTELEGPAPLYMFLTEAKPQTQVKLLEVLARSGDAETLDRINPYAASLDPKIAEAAQFAAREITRRLAQTPTDAPGRPRRISK